MELGALRARVATLRDGVRAGDREAGWRVASRLPRAWGRSVDDVLAGELADDELEVVIARELGLPTWARLVAELAEVHEPPALHRVAAAGDVAAIRALRAAGAHPWMTREALEQAIVRDDREVIRALLDCGAWVDFAGRQHGRWGGALHAALLLGRDAALLELLLAGGAAIDARDRDGRTAYAIAIRTAHAAAADVLRRAGARADDADDLDRALGAAITGAPGAGAPLATARRISDHQHLAWAIRRGHADAVPRLLALGLDPDVADDDGSAPLHLAVLTGAVDTVAQLVAAGARVDADERHGDTAYALAARRGDAALAARLVAAGASTALPLDVGELFEDAADAVVAGDLSALTALLAREPRLVRARSLRDHRAMLLHYCGANGTEDRRQRTPPNAPDVARLLLSHGADPNALVFTYGGGPAQTTLYLAATSSHPVDAGCMTPLIEALVAGGARVELDDRDALHTSQRAALPALVAAGAHVDLWLAAALGRDADVRRLAPRGAALAAGAKIGSEATTPDAVILGRALLAAAGAGHLPVVAHLLDAGAALEFADVRRFTALHLAAWQDHLAVAELLVARGASRTAKNVHGGTALGTLQWSIEHEPRDRPHAGALATLLAV
jgi:ankyrin repeat protein|nr:ankyrin repeat domain-containing protein [Kofleriaceae bacterium]